VEGMLSLQTNRMIPSNVFVLVCDLYILICSSIHRRKLKIIGMCTFNCFDVGKPVLSQTIGILD
jgi:hypothetical protein